MTRSLGGNSASDQKLQVVRHLGGRRGREEGLVRDVIGTVREHPGYVIKLQIARSVFVRPGPAARRWGRPATPYDPRSRRNGLGLSPTRSVRLIVRPPRATTPPARRSPPQVTQTRHPDPPPPDLRAASPPRRVRGVVPPEDARSGKLAARPANMVRRRIGDLNPGWDHSQTALAVRRHRPD